MNVTQLIRSCAVFVLLLSASLNLFAQKTFTINGQIGKYQQGVMTVKYIYNNQDVSDSSKVTDGKFSLKGQIEEPEFASLTFIPSNKKLTGEYREMFLDPGKITIAGDSSILTADFKGGPSVVDFVTFMKLLIPNAKKNREFNELAKKAREEDDKDKMKELGKVYAEIRKERADIQDAFIKSHPDSFVAFSLWTRKADRFIDPVALEPEFNAFSAKVKATKMGKLIAARLATAKTLLPGNMAPDFTLNDLSGKPVSLSSLKGKNVVLFFWARNYMPFEPLSFSMLKISKQFKSDNLVILSVYYDAPGSQYQWKNVLEESSLMADNIINVRDPVLLNSEESGAERSEVMKSYDMSSNAGPHAYLISPEGKILIRGLDWFKDPVADIRKGLEKK